MIIHNSENSSLIYLKNRKLIYATIVGFCSGDEIKKAASSLKVHSHEINAFFLLIDTSKTAIIKDSDMQTIKNILFPVFREVGIKKTAIIKSENVFGQLSIAELIKDVQISEVKEFLDLNSAENWLFAK
jgi:hypothetical protein